MESARSAGLHWLAGNRGMLIALLAALTCRLGAYATLSGAISLRVPLLDAQHYLETAMALAHGSPWPAGPHFMAPVYPALLAGLFRIVPPGIETVRIAQMILGLATTALIVLAARRAHPVAGTVAGLLYATCGPAIVYENQLLMESLLAFALAALVWTAGGPWPLRGWRAAAGGLAIGLAAAGRPVYGLLLILLVPAVLCGRRDRSLVASVALLLVGFAVPTAPPTIHNWKATGRPSFVTVSGGLNLFIGNNAQARGVYSQPAGLFLDQDPTGARSASAAAGRRLDAEGASRYYADKAWSFLQDNPGAWLRLWVRKAGFFLGPDEVPQIEDYHALQREHPPLRVLGICGFFVLLPLATAGAVRWKGTRSTRLLALGIIAAGAVVHILFFSTGRYRASLLPSFAVLAGWGVVLVVDAARSHRWKDLTPMLAAALVLVAAPRYDRSKAEAWGYHMDGQRYARIGAPRSAEEMYERALRIDPGLGESWHNLGACLASQDRLADAIRMYEQALAILGENPITLYNLGVLHGRLGLDQRALEYLDRAVAADPQDPAARVDRGVALYRLSRTEEAYADWRLVASTSPTEASLGRTLGRLRAAGVHLPVDLESLATRP